MFRRSLPFFAFPTVILAVVVAQSSAFSQSRFFPDVGTFNSLPVTASVSGDQVRFTALALTQRMRLEIVSSTGEPLYDSGFQPGNLLEWRIGDQQGFDSRDGFYGCLVSVEDLQSRISHRRGVFRLKDGRIFFSELEQQPISGYSTDERENLIILQPDDPAPFTLVSHDGEEGWIESSRGGLSFYAGAVSAKRRDIPHLRLTPEGNVGIGVEEPQAKLDVAGLIKATEGFQFQDGTILKMEEGMPVLVYDSPADLSALGAYKKEIVGPVPSASRSGAAKRSLLFRSAGPYLANQTSGTMGRIAKFVNSIDLGDSVITEANGLIGIGTVPGTFSLEVAGEIYSSSSYSDHSFYLNNTGPGGHMFRMVLGKTGDSVPGGFGLYDSTAGAYRLAIDATGNVGIGTYTPTSKLAVDGPVESTTVYKINGATVLDIAGINNAFGGADAGIANTSGDDNTFFGYHAGYVNSSGHSNTFVGSEAGVKNTTGYWNTFFGNGAGYANTTGNLNAFFGVASGVSNTTGSNNSFFARHAGQANTTGSENSFFGRHAGYSNTAGNKNSFFGMLAGDANLDTDGNSAFGYNADIVAGITNSTAIGLNSQVTQSNSLVLGSINGINGATASVNVGIGTTAPLYRLHVVAGSGYAAYFAGNVHVAGRFTFDSDAKFKKEIEDLHYGLQAVMRLHPVSWRWKDRTDEKLSFGLIAQETQSVIPDVVQQTAIDSGTLGIDYVSLVPVLVKAIQEQQDELTRKDAEIASLKTRLTMLEQMIEPLAKQQMAGGRKP